MTDWTLDLLFGRDIEQMITLRDIEATARQIGRLRGRRSRASGPPAWSDQLLSDGTPAAGSTSNAVNEVTAYAIR
jgi:hypothetical protein